MEEYWRWFMYQTKILPEQRVKCLEYFETPENMFIAPAAKVEKAEFLSEAAREELLRTRTAGELSREEKELQEKEIDFYSMEHPAYPARLREIPHAPCGLFVKGRLPQFEKEKKKVQAAAIVGARWASHVGLSLAKETAGALALEGIPVISGIWLLENIRLSSRLLAAKCLIVVPPLPSFCTPRVMAAAHFPATSGSSE